MHESRLAASKTRSEGPAAPNASPPERHDVCGQRVLEQPLPHPGRRRGQGGRACRYLDGPADTRAGRHARRAANGKLLVAENGSGKISVITVNGDKASVAVIREGLNTPTAVEPAGDVIWIAERGAGRALSIPMPK
jgi:hypothetical protein